MFVLLYFSHWFSITETAITNLSSLKIATMKKRKEKNVDYIIELKKDMDRTLIALLVGNNTVNILLSSLAALIANYFFHAIGISIVIGIMTIMVVLLGEIVPKSKALRNSTKITSNHAKIVYYLKIGLKPIIETFIFLSRLIIRFKQKEDSDKNLLVTEENIKELTTLIESEGAIKKIEKDIIHQVFLFGDKKVKDIMVPMKHIFFFQENYDVKSARKILSEKGFTRVPIMNEKGKVIGILYSKDLLKPKKGNVMEIMRKPVVVSGNMDITTVFSSMKKSRIHLAVVRDSKYKHVGIVTLEDILEELVGEIEDEYHDVKYPKKN